MSEVFIKKLQKQESGYSKDKPNQRGKYILIPKKSLSLFPVFSKEYLNDAKIIKANLDGSESIGLNIVYHNAKFFPDIKKRGHNELRIYRNVFLDEALALDRSVIVIIIKLHNNDYAFGSVLATDPNYREFENLASDCQEKGLLKLENLKSLNLIKRLSTIQNKSEVLNSKELIKTTNKIIEGTAKSYKKARVQQPAMLGDSAAIFSSLIKSQSDFAKFLREIYNNKCAIRGTSLIADNHAGLDAAHIQADSHEGPLLPSNGILLSSDLHKCFDQGYLGLSHDNKVMIRNDVPISSELYKYKGKLIKPIKGFELCAPFHAYNEFHRKEHNIL